MMMRRLVVVCAVAASCLPGCKELNLQLPEIGLQTAEEKARENTKEALRGEEGHSRLIGDYITVAGLNVVVLEGIGLVTQLDGTGDDPPTSHYRTAVYQDMQAREIENPNQILADASTTIVMVRAYLPPLIKKGETFDVEVRLPEGSGATSLKGGVLLECDLAEQAFVPGRGLLRGHRRAIAHGPILVGAGDEAQDVGHLGRGTIPGGAVYAGDDRHLSIFLRPDYRNARMADRIARRIGQRFHDYDQYGIKRPLADAKSDSRIELVVHSRYRDNYPRFLQCIRHMSLLDRTVDRHFRMQQLREQIMVGPTAEKAALVLEAIGKESTPILKEALKADNLESRFHAATALAYLGDSSGAEALREAAEQEPAFRIHALAVMAAIDNGTAAVELHKLLDHPSMETRYGAVRALSKLDPNDPAIVAREAPSGFELRIIESEREPMVHVTRRKKMEITVFGEAQEFQAPMTVSAGKRFIVRIEPGQSVARISKFTPGRETERVQVPARVADVIRELMRLEASYPDVVQMLVEAEEQHNLPGRIGIDALPRAGRVYTRPTAELASGPATEIRVGHENMTPNLFGVGDDPTQVDAPDERFEEDETAVMAPGAESGPVSFTVQ